MMLPFVSPDADRWAAGLSLLSWTPQNKGNKWRRGENRWLGVIVGGGSVFKRPGCVTILCLNVPFTTGGFVFLTILFGSA